MKAFKKLNSWLWNDPQNRSVEIVPSPTESHAIRVHLYFKVKDKRYVTSDQVGPFVDAKDTIKKALERAMTSANAIIARNG